MMKITTHNNGNVMTLKPEGTLAGQWVSELRTCWQQAVAEIEPRFIRVDLTGVTHTDTAGSELLSVMYCHGAEFMVGDVLMKAIVENIAKRQRA